MFLKRLVSKIAHRLHADERGFSMIVTIGAITMLTLSAAISSTMLSSDQVVGAQDLQRKVAFSTAESGLQAYIHRLTADSNYWTKCVGNKPGQADGHGAYTQANGPNQTDAVNQIWTPTPGAADKRAWANLPDNSGAYTVEQIPANGKPACSTTDPVGTMVDTATATFRVRVTGRALNKAGVMTGPYRSVIATFKRKSFLDYIYYTTYETTDPALYPGRFAPGATNTKESAGRCDVSPADDPLCPSGQRNITQWGNDVCAKEAYTQLPAPNNKTRPNQSFSGTGSSAGQYSATTGKWTSLTATCPDIQFGSSDYVAGPLHTEDSPYICGTPAFGRSPADAIEVVAPNNSSDSNVADSYRTAPTSSCGTSVPDVNFGTSTAKANRGTWLMNQASILMPPSNGALATETTSAYTFLGKTTIVLAPTTITVSGGVRKSDGLTMANTVMPYPTNGLIYVRNTTCPGLYDISQPYATGRLGCGDAYVKGNYAGLLTIGAQNDIVINGNIINNAPTSGLLGLVAQNFIRLYHNINSSGDNTSDDLTDPLIHAALLTVAHSFIVDNYDQGDPLGTLTITGSIAQLFRGAVGTGSGKTMSTGYSKNYAYDDRLKTLSPPDFLDPVQASWRLQTYQEQSPATQFCTAAPC